MIKLYGSGRLMTDPSLENVTIPETGETAQVCRIRIVSGNGPQAIESSVLEAEAWGDVAKYVMHNSRRGAYVEFDGELAIPEGLAPCLFIDNIQVLSPEDVGVREDEEETEGDTQTAPAVSEPPLSPFPPIPSK